MNPATGAFLRSWPSSPLLVFSLLLSAGVYLRGWMQLRRRNPRRWQPGQLAAFWGGLTAIFLALASPIESFSSLVLSVHMVQHLLLMMVAAPLIWLGAPLFPILCGLPDSIRKYWIGPLTRSVALRRLFEHLTHPLVALPLFVAATWLWHAPAAYDAALRSEFCHYLEHACFLGTALLFWHPVVRPFPSRPRWSLWLLVPYLIMADVQNTALSAVLTFSSRPFYRFYTEAPPLAGLDALRDQAAAGVLMWVPGSLVYLVPLFVIGVRLMFSPDRVRRSIRGPEQGARKPLRRVNKPRTRSTIAFDLLQAPLLGRFLHWRHARTALQIPLALLAGVLILDGLRGPQTAAVNLAGVLPWIHWRGLTILALLTVGNVFCMACPFTLPRRLARNWLGHGREWPRWLRTKWVAVGLVALFLWAYETFSLWDSPWWTAWIAVGYFVVAFAVDAFFRGGVFCKYLCPIGQFNFVQSLASPMEVAVRSHDVCASCRTHDCIRGNEEVPGCELRLYQPRKQGNMDCTFCLDCVHACPHDNIGLIAGLPGRDLWRDTLRSGIGRFSRRHDLAAMVVIVVFGSFSNAAGMVAPVLELQDRLRVAWGNPAPWLITTLFACVSLLLLPGLAVGGAAAVSSWWGGLSVNWIQIATRFAYALIPLGFGMWLAHYSFHFFTSWETVIPASQRMGNDLGWTFLGTPRYVCACCRPIGDWLLQSEIVCLDLGLLLSLYIAYRIAVAQSASGRGGSQALRVFAPWGTLIVVLFVAALWIVFQPMQMRGTLPGII